MIIEPWESKALLDEENRYIANIKARWGQESLPEDTEHKLRMGKRTELLGDLQWRKE